MDKKRRLIVQAGFAGMAAVLSGCVTQALLSDPSYSEEVSSILFSEDGKSIVILGDKHHYIFASHDIIKASIESEIQSALAATFSGFTVDKANHITGSLTLTIKNEASDALKQNAIKLGYTTRNDGSVEYSSEITGMRYSADGIAPVLERQKLNKPYEVTITEPQGEFEHAAKLMVSPITIALDVQIQYSPDTGPAPVLFYATSESSVFGRLASPSKNIVSGVLPSIIRP